MYHVKDDVQTPEEASSTCGTNAGAPTPRICRNIMTRRPETRTPAIPLLLRWPKSTQGASDETLAQAVANIFNCAGGYSLPRIHSHPATAARPPRREGFTSRIKFDDRPATARPICRAALSRPRYRIEFSQGYVEVGDLDTIRGWVGYCRRYPAKTKEFAKNLDRARYVARGRKYCRFRGVRAGQKGP